MTSSDNIYKIQQVLRLLEDTWTPHSGQVKVGQAVFGSEADFVYVDCGRKFGKSENGVYMCWMWALTRPNSEVYYLAPMVKQAREIVWANYRMQSCNSYKQDFVKEVQKILGGEVKILNQEMRIILPNGSFIKVDGSDNVESQRGLKPDLVVADEYRDFEPGWIEAVRPNMLVKHGKIVFTTTPPHGPNHAYEMAEECRRGVDEGDNRYFYLNMPSNTNDRIPGHTQWLETERTRLLRAGRQNEWRREYMAEFVVSDEHAVIPQLNRDLLKPHDQVTKELREEDMGAGEPVEYYLGIDPTNSTNFGAVFAAFAPHTARLYLLDEVRVWDSEKTSVRAVYELLEAKAKGLGIPLERWTVVVNPRTPWYARDLHDIHDIAATPAPADVNKLETNVSLIKDICISGKMQVSDRMSETIRESEKWMRNKKTHAIPKIAMVPLVNAVRYVVSACAYTSHMVARPEPKPEDEQWVDYWENRPSAQDHLREIMARELGIIDDLDW